MSDAMIVRLVEDDRIALNQEVPEKLRQLIQAFLHKVRDAIVGLGVAGNIRKFSENSYLRHDILHLVEN
jgi:hypothetical protein